MDENLKQARYLHQRKALKMWANNLPFLDMPERDDTSWRLKKCNPHGRTDKYFDRSGVTTEWDERGNIISVTKGKWRSHTYYSLAYRANKGKLKKVRTQGKRKSTEMYTNSIRVEVGKRALSPSEVREANLLYHARKHGRFMR